MQALMLTVCSEMKGPASEAFTSRSFWGLLKLEESDRRRTNETHKHSNMMQSYQ